MSETENKLGNDVVDTFASVRTYTRMVSDSGPDSFEARAYRQAKRNNRVFGAIADAVDRIARASVAGTPSEDEVITLAGVTWTRGQLDAFDGDGRSCRIGEDDPGDLRIPSTSVEWNRAITSARRDENPEAWKHGNLTFVNNGTTYCLVGLNAEDLGILMNFLAVVKQRLESY